VWSVLSAKFWVITFNDLTLEILFRSHTLIAGPAKGLKLTDFLLEHVKSSR
jgi:hypothetical protein